MPTPIRPEPVIIARTFPAPKALVFKAFSSADHMKRWFSPATYTVPEAEVDFRPGGTLAICMRSPDGHDFWSRGRFLEIQPHDRLIFEMNVIVDNTPRFTAHTTVTFQEDGAGTRITVHQAYEIFDEAFISSVQGAAEGWRTTLDKLGREVARIEASEIPGASLSPP